MSERLAEKIRDRRASDDAVTRDAEKYLQAVRNNEQLLIELEVLKALLEREEATLQ